MIAKSPLLSIFSIMSDDDHPFPVFPAVPDKPPSTSLSPLCTDYHAIRYHRYAIQAREERYQTKVRVGKYLARSVDGRAERTEDM